jgi:presenilin-like A22 family membrane protease
VIIALPLALFKMFKRNFIIHNLTELLIYPGIATIFVSILNFWTAIILLVIISFYDMWAVWRSGIMQKMAKYQMNNLKVFAGFFVPYISKNIRMRLKKLRRNKKFKDKKIKVNVAILGGGDVIFPIITSGVILTSARIGTLPSFLSNLAKPLFGVPGLITALAVIAGATLGLTLLFMFSKKKKFYPAMPFITAGIFIGLILSYFFL